jgi:hypothetical protein
MSKLPRPDARALAAVAALAIGATTATTSQAFADIWSGPRSHPPPVQGSHNHGGDANRGNLVVSVPPVPPRRDLRRLCTILLWSPGGGSGANGYSKSKASQGDAKSHDQYDSVPDLIAATGGSRASAIKWCQQYLHPDHRKRHR